MRCKSRNPKNFGMDGLQRLVATTLGDHGVAVVGLLDTPPTASSKQVATICWRKT